MKNLLNVLLLFLVTFIFAQDIEFPPLSPKGTIEQVIGNTTFKIEYERPSARGRVIFGELVPWGEVWRTGAGACTKISFDKPVTIFDQEIPAGTYSIFTKPDASEWFIMLNEDTTLRGTRNYSSAKNVIQIVSEVERTKRFYETMTFDIEMKDNNALISLSWEKTRVSFLIETSTNDKINAQIKSELLSGKNTNADNYAGGASFLLTRETDLVTALDLAERAVKLDPQSEWARNLKIEICEKLEKYQEAIEEIDATILMLNSKNDRAAEINKLKGDRGRLEKLLKKQK